MGNWGNYFRLVEHLDQAEMISNRLAEASVDLDAPNVTRTRRSRGDVDTATSEPAAASTPTVIVACQPLVDQLRTMVETSRMSVNELISEARSALMKLLEAFQAHSR